MPLLMAPKKRKYFFSKSNKTSIGFIQRKLQKADEENQRPKKMESYCVYGLEDLSIIKNQNVRLVQSHI